MDLVDLLQMDLVHPHTIHFPSQNHKISQQMDLEVHLQVDLVHRWTTSRWTKSIGRETILGKWTPRSICRWTRSIGREPMLSKMMSAMTMRRRKIIPVHPRLQ